MVDLHRTRATRFGLPIAMRRLPDGTGFQADNSQNGFQVDCGVNLR